RVVGQWSCLKLLSCRALASGQCVYSKLEFPQGKWFDQIVVTSQREAFLFVGQSSLCRHENDWCVVAQIFSDSSADFEARDRRQHHIQNNDIVGVMGQEVECGQTIGSKIERIVFVTEELYQVFRKRSLILNDQYACLHFFSLLLRMAAESRRSEERRVGKEGR